MPTFSEFVRQEYLPYAYQAKPGSAHDDESKFRLHLEPKWGNLRLCDVTTRDVQMHHAAMRQSHSAGTANRHLALISATFRKALEWGRVDRNPAAGVKAFREENQRQRFLTADEIGEYSGQAKEVKPVTIATYQILTAKRKGQYAHLDVLDALDWGLIVYDEVHLLPAPVFKLTADLQARRRLGLTATLAAKPNS